VLHSNAKEMHCDTAMHINSSLAVEMHWCRDGVGQSSQPTSPNRGTIFFSRVSDIRPPVLKWSCRSGQAEGVVFIVFLQAGGFVSLLF
jgi:hypothetical protein